MYIKADQTTEDLRAVIALSEGSVRFPAARDRSAAAAAVSSVCRRHSKLKGCQGGVGVAVARSFLTSNASPARVSRTNFSPLFGFSPYSTAAGV